VRRPEVLEFEDDFLEGGRHLISDFGFTILDCGGIITDGLLLSISPITIIP
jgi:hypothetical protein